MNFYNRFAIRHQIKKLNLVYLGVILLLVALTAFYRFYPPITHPALLQFDVFDWARQSREIFMEHRLVTPTSLWVFPVWNAIVAAVTRVDLFNVYLYSGAVLTTLNCFIILGIGSMLWKQKAPRLALLVLYAVNTQLLARSVNYLPETMSFTFGLGLVALYLWLFRKRKIWILIPIAVLTYLYYHLHQSGLNFIVFSALVTVGYFLFAAPYRKRHKALVLLGCLALGIILIISQAPLRQQFLFFLAGDKNADIAFQGTAIPLAQFLTDYPLIVVVLMLLGAVGIIVRQFKVGRTADKFMWLMILLIPLTYFSFLYVLPNLKLYSLTPWRFYTWFSLYALIVAAEGFAIVYQSVIKSRLRLILLPVLVLLTIHTPYLPDNMFTADQNTLKDIEKYSWPNNSNIITTNANYLQTKYALSGKGIEVQQQGVNFFKAANSQTAATLLEGYPLDSSIFVLISKYQLRQRPSSIDYWRNSSIFDTRLENFQDSRYFTRLFENENILVYKVNASSLSQH